MIHVGIDLHSRNMTLVALNDNGKLSAEEKFGTTPAKLMLFFKCFDKPVQAVVECTSYWYWLADWCNKHKIPLTLAHAKMLKAISYAKVKTDSVDARALADLLRAGLIPEAYKTETTRRDLRELTRRRLRMIQRGGRLQSILWQLAAQYNVRAGCRPPLPGAAETVFAAAITSHCTGRGSVAARTDPPHSGSYCSPRSSHRRTNGLPQGCRAIEGIARLWIGLRLDDCG